MTLLNLYCVMGYAVSSVRLTRHLLSAYLAEAFDVRKADVVNGIAFFHRYRHFGIPSYTLDRDRLRRQNGFQLMSRSERWKWDDRPSTRKTCRL